MSTKTKEVAQVEVLTPEQIAAFPKVVKENIQFLSEEMNPRDLATFNPLVSELLKLREIGSKLKMRNPSPDGDFDKDNIQQFVDLKKDVRSYRAEVKRSAKDLKEPYNKIQKGIIAIEKVFIEEATTVYEEAEKEFDQYIKAEEAKAAAKEAEKNKELLEATAKAEAEANEQRLKSQKSEVYNYIKYDQIAEGITSKTSTAIVESNERSLKELLEEIKGKTFEGISKIKDTSILDADILTELEVSFNTSKKNAETLINDKIESYKTQREKEALEARNSNPVLTPTPIQQIETAAEKIDQNIPPNIPPAPGSRPNIETYNNEVGENLTDEEFIHNIKGRIDLIYRLVEDRISMNPTSSPDIYKMKTIINSVKQSI